MGGRERHHGSPSVGEGGVSAKTSWVSNGRWEGRERHHGSPMVGGGGVGKDTIDL